MTFLLELQFTIFPFQSISISKHKGMHTFYEYNNIFKKLCVHGFKVRRCTRKMTSKYKMSLLSSFTAYIKYDIVIQEILRIHICIAELFAQCKVEYILRAANK